jgi:hypothetical protein
VLRALDDDALREHAAARNLAIVAERADYARGMARASSFYERVRASKTTPVL